jgi:hypothetical protein
VWMEAPSEQVIVDVLPGMSSRDAEKEAKKLARRFRIVVQPFDSRSVPSREGSWGNKESPVSPGSLHHGQGRAPNQTPVKPYMAPLQQAWGYQQTAQLDGKHTEMVQELPGPLAAPFIAELDSGDFQRPPELPLKVPPKVPLGGGLK